MPVVSRIGADSDRWRWTPLGLREAVLEVAPANAEVEVSGVGNGLAARAFLFGLAAEDLGEGVLAHADPDYPLIVGARVTLPG